jgi:nitronate monooxygenase
MVVNNIPPIKIGGLEFFLIQGGMGVGISQAGLASAVANEGGAGVIASVGLGAIKGHFSELLKENKSRIENASSEERKIIFNELYALSNQIALREEIQKAKRKTNGVIGVNIMHALSDYSSLVRGAVNEDVDLIISGAGIPRDLPSYLRSDSQTKLIPIVSSARVAEMILKSWARLGHLPDAVIIEGPMAGGHLGYSYEQLANPEFVAKGLEGIFREVKEVVGKYETSKNSIPIIVAGGLYYGGDFRKFVEMGAAGAQIATRMTVAIECDAPLVFKQKVVDCKKEDLEIIQSPVGMPGRAIRNEFLERVKRGEKIPISCPYHCLKTCVPEKSLYCIANSLTSAFRGNLDAGYVFAGSSAWRCNEILPVAKIFEKLDQEYAGNKKSE